MSISLLLLKEAPEKQNTTLSDRLLLMTFLFGVFSTLLGMTMDSWG